MECLVAYLVQGEPAVRTPVERLAEIGDLAAAIGYLETASDHVEKETDGARAGNPADCTSTGVTRSLILGLRHTGKGPSRRPRL